MTTTLWCLTESAELPEHLGAGDTVITNRYDLYQRIHTLDIRCFFNDFEFNQLPALESYSTLILPVAKEKAINLHIITSFFSHFGKHAALIIEGEKQQGLPSLEKLLKTSGAKFSKSKGSGKTKLLKVAHTAIDFPPSAYHELSAVPGTSLLNKAGCYGFNKVDVGSKLLISVFKEQLAQTSKHGSLLDLGCGYGYLSIEARKLGFSPIDATDNNAAAIRACEENFKRYDITGQVIADNCGEQLQKQYDVVLCNPPFHQGFDHNKDLIDHFVKNASKRVKKGGFALFVVNQFIGIEKSTKKHFTNTHLIVKNKGFKVLRLSHDKITT